MVNKEKIMYNDRKGNNDNYTYYLKSYDISLNICKYYIYWQFQ